MARRLIFHRQQRLSQATKDALRKQLGPRRNESPGPPVKMLVFPAGMLTKVTVESKLADEGGRKSRGKKKFRLASLPHEILLVIFDILNVFDATMLALTCKHLAGVASIYSHLVVPCDREKPRDIGWKPRAEGNFLKKRLGDGFFPKRLKYCWSCKHYVPRRKSYWKKHLGKKSWEGGSLTSKRWEFEYWWKAASTEKMLKQWSPGAALKCPRCKLCRSLGIEIL